MPLFFRESPDARTRLSAWEELFRPTSLLKKMGLNPGPPAATGGRAASGGRGIAAGGRGAVTRSGGGDRRSGSRSFGGGNRRGR